ncbi:MAG TPA: hypothetical protein VGX49_12600 [Jatrophihabitans sp.]|jgi:hypothetical protein|nr:hypothetical protein [Jatrophihabitans sp.]
MGFDLGILVWAAGILGVLTLVMRWVFQPSRPRTGRPQGGPNADLGLLVPVLSHAPRARVLAAKNLLSERGIRCSVSRLDRDSYDLLVFGADADRAHRLLDGHPG